MTSMKLYKKMEVMGSGKLVAVLIGKTPQQCGRSCVCRGETSVPLTSAPYMLDELT
jgi:hypothetical protein